jgi:hypothetical protein
MISRPQAAPTSVLRSRYAPCTHGIPLDVAQNGQQMFVALHREALESTLIKMSVTHGPMRDPPAHRMRVPQPTEEGRDLAVGLRPDNKVPTPARQVLFALLLAWAGNLARKQWPLSILAASLFPSRGGQVDHRPDTYIVLTVSYDGQR